MNWVWCLDFIWGPDLGEGIGLYWQEKIYCFFLTYNNFCIVIIDLVENYIIVYFFVWEKCLFQWKFLFYVDFEEGMIIVIPIIHPASGHLPLQGWLLPTFLESIVFECLIVYLIFNLTFQRKLMPSPTHAQGKKNPGLVKYNPFRVWIIFILRINFRSE